MWDYSISWPWSRWTTELLESTRIDNYNWQEGWHMLKLLSILSTMNILRRMTEKERMRDTGWFSRCKTYKRRCKMWKKNHRKQLWLQKKGHFLSLCVSLGKKYWCDGTNWRVGTNNLWLKRIPTVIWCNTTGEGESQLTKDNPCQNKCRLLRTTWY